MNTFGHLFRMTSFGESHGKALGVVVDNCPPGILLDEADIQKELDRRRPGQSDMTTPRKEADQCQILSGIFEGKTTGTPLAIVVQNSDQQSKDYDALKDVFRPSHADYSFLQKYGIRDHRGGGRSSARTTIAQVAAGAIAKKILRERFETDIFGFTQAIGTQSFPNVDQGFIEENPLRMADRDAFEAAQTEVLAAKEAGDSLGGVIEVRATNVISGLGSPAFGKLEAELARAMMTVPATKGFEIGEGFSLTQKKGSEANDGFKRKESGVRSQESDVITERNANGGILGGISTGEDIWFRVAIKPTSSIGKKQKTIDKEGKEQVIGIEGRHDPILLPRAVPILEAMTALVLLDHVMLHEAQCGGK